MQLPKIFSLAVALLVKVCSVFGTHVVGGEITYQYISGNNYKIRLDLYIDCLNGNPQAIAQDATAFIGVFDGVNGNILNGYPVEIPRSGPQKVVKLNYNCIKTYPNACVNHYWYETTLNLPARTGGYILSFQRCCRNNSITNLVNPQSTGANYWTKIPDSRTLPDKKPNSSAVFKELPANFLCTNYELKFDHGAKDADGDSLAYDFFQPFDGAGQNQPRPDNKGNGTLANPPFANVVYSGSYNAQIPIDGNPILKIDAETGLLTLTPTKSGQFVVGIRVREYRKGVLISETKRDYQFNVDLCVIDVVASYYAPKFICGFTYKFDNKSTGATRYHWNFGLPGNADTSNQTYPTVTYPGPGKYRVSLIAYKNNCLDSFANWVTVVSPNVPKLPADSTICTGRSIKYSSSVIGDSYLWSNGSSFNSITVNKPGTYWLQVTISTCAWRDTVKLNVDTSRVWIAGDTTFCSDAVFSRKLTATQGMALYAWNTGNTTNQITVSSAGKYFVSVLTKYGCASSDSALIQRFSPVVVSLLDTVVCPNALVTVNALNKDARKLWSNGDTTSITRVVNPGNYWVKVTRGTCSSYDTFNLSNFGYEFELGQDLRFCSTIDTSLNIIDTRFSQIVWNKEINGRTYNLKKEGKVIVSLINSHNCPELDSINVLLFPNPSLDLGSDTTVCLSINPMLTAPAGMRSYLWQDKTTERVKVAVEKGLYWVEVTDMEGCRSKDSVMILKDPTLFPSIVYMPNAFTPDGNGRNDLYPSNKYVNIGSLYKVKLYNRWGEKIADFDSPDINWDGKIGGIEAQEGVYVYRVSWIGCDNEFYSMSGSFHLLR